MAVELVQEIGRRITRVTEDSRETVFYRAMLCIRGTSHGPVSVRPSVCLSVRHKSEFY